MGGGPMGGPGGPMGGPMGGPGGSLGPGGPMGAPAMPNQRNFHFAQRRLSAFDRCRLLRAL
jgi:hypothetical protein